MLLYDSSLVSSYSVDTKFPIHILFTDEATFTRDDVNNSRNSHVMSNRNPQL